MEAIIERCCGLDVHRDTIAACLLTGKADQKPSKAMRTFGTMSHELRELVRWLRDAGCTHVAMESTGVYWMAPYKALEEHVEVVVGNAKHLAKVPGRKTDALDSEWIAELLRHGLIRKSFIPPPAIRELRDLTRYRRKLVQSRSGERNRLQKMLEMANIKLASVMSDVFGASGMAILRALVAGDCTPVQMAGLARGQLRKKKRLLELALDAPFEDHHRYLLRTQLGRLEELDCNIADVETRIAEKLEPYSEQYTRLMQIPGVKGIAASVLIAELGVDMSVFDSAAACASWAGVSPGNDESAGKRKNSRTSRGNPNLKPILVEAAQAASRKKGSYLHDKFHKIRSRRGYKRAVVAIAHKILIAAYHMLATGEGYRELGEDYLDSRNQQRLTKRLVDRLEGLGYQVTLVAQESAADSSQPPPPVQQAGNDDAHSTSDSPGLDPKPIPSDVPDSSPPLAVSSVEPEQKGQPTVRASENDAPSSPAGSSSSHKPDTSVASPRSEGQSGPLRRSRRRQAASKPKHKPGPRDPRIPPSGTTLTRVFKGVEHRVLVIDDGFEYAGDFYATISGAAKAITGTSSSGYAFFRLNPPKTKGKDTLSTP